MKRVQVLLLVLTVVSTMISCATEPMTFDSTKSLDDWYAETATMGGNQIWGPIAYPLPPREGITVNRLNLGESVVTDFYYPPDYLESSPLPVIITPRNFKMDAEYALWGRSMLTWDYEISWAHLLSGNGYCVVKMETSSPVTGLIEIINFIQENHKALHIDPEKIGFFAVSDNPGVVLQVLARDDMDVTGFKAQVFLYPTMDAVPFTMLHYIPTFIATGGLDKAQTNRVALRYVENCKKAGYDYVYYHHPQGVHGFDYHQKDEATREIIAAAMDFFDTRLGKADR
jgi:hypothetical protein